jgi:uncharacterized protein YdhG (YjbR/CyaY superfamily)
MISQAASVDDFLKTVSPEEKKVFGKIRMLLKKAHPRVYESMKYRMPTYLVGDYHLGAFNKQKNYLCLYLNPVAVDPHRKALKAAGIDCGKSCLRFTKPEQLPLTLAADIISHAATLAEK